MSHGDPHGARSERVVVEEGGNPGLWSVGVQSKILEAHERVTVEQVIDEGRHIPAAHIRSRA